MSDSYSSSYINPLFKGAVKILIIINILVFIIAHIFGHIPWLVLFGLVPALVFTRFMLWQLVTYFFMHFGLWHLILNMLMLWMFGSVIENTWGSKRFLIYYFFTGIGAGIGRGFHPTIQILRVYFSANVCPDSIGGSHGS